MVGGSKESGTGATRRGCPQREESCECAGYGDAGPGKRIDDIDLLSSLSALVI